MVSSETSQQSPRKQWVVNYTQSDVDTIREQIEENEALKRRWLMLFLIIAVGAFVGTVVLFSARYAQYASSESEKKKLADENAALKLNVETYRQQLKAATAAGERETQARAEAQSKLDTLLPAVINARASDSEIAAFARMVSQLPFSRVEVDAKPPDKLFRNWRALAGEATETYTLVGGFVDGKWVIHSNLVARK